MRPEDGGLVVEAARSDAAAVDRVAGSCPVCAGRKWSDVGRLPAIPVNSITLWPSRTEARGCARGDVDLGACVSCGAISNRSFEPARLVYDGQYDNSLHVSPVFLKYAQALAAELVETYELRGREVIDVGCGNGEFLALLCQVGDNRGLGFDPSFIPGRMEAAAGRGVTVVPQYFDDSHAGHCADAVVCRQVLEHIAQPRPFVEMLLRVLAGRPDGLVIVEVPNAAFVLRDGSVWDVIYEHCLYYSAPALRRLFEMCGLEVVDVQERFGGQYLTIVGRPSTVPLPGRPAEGVGPSDLDALEFQARYDATVRSRRDLLLALAPHRGRAVLWGAGAKGTMFLNAMGDDAPIETVVDLNPHKHGRFIPGTGQMVVPPEALLAAPPQVVLFSNPNYRSEIADRLAALGLYPDLHAI